VRGYAEGDLVFTADRFNGSYNNGEFEVAGSYIAPGTPVYLHGDHLGSASLTTDATGGVANEMRYYAYGGTRSGTMDTEGIRASDGRRASACTTTTPATTIPRWGGLCRRIRWCHRWRALRTLTDTPTSETILSGIRILAGIPHNRVLTSTKLGNSDRDLAHPG
jgi:hypothetical protein